MDYIMMYATHQTSLNRYSNRTFVFEGRPSDPYPISVSIFSWMWAIEHGLELNWIELNLIHLRDAAYKSTSGAIQRINKWNK